MKNIKAIIFDFDDTLALSSEEVIRAIERTAQTCDLPCPEQEAIRELFGRPIHAIIETFWPFADPDEFMQTYRQVYNIQNVKLVEGATPMLALLQQSGFELHILTSRRRQSLLEHLQEFGIKDLFTLLIGSEDVEHHKPDPRVFTIFLEKYKPEEIVYVGDSIYDAQAAKQAGLSFIGVCTGMVRKEGFELEKADLILDSITQMSLLFQEKSILMANTSGK